MKLELNDLKALVPIIGAAVAAVLYFAPMKDVDANAEKIAMISAQQELAMWEDTKSRLEEDCLDRKNNKWLCSDRERAKWRSYYRKIQVLENKLGIESIPEELPPE